MNEGTCTQTKGSIRETESAIWTHDATAWSNTRLCLDCSIDFVTFLTSNRFSEEEEAAAVCSGAFSGSVSCISTSDMIRLEVEHVIKT